MGRTGVSATARCLTQRLMAHEAVLDGSANATIDTCPVCEKLRIFLSTTLGLDSYRFLLGQALTSAKQEAPLLAEVSVGPVQRRYQEYCVTCHVESSRSLAPREFTEGDVHWIYPVMEEVIQGIEEGDAACVALGVDFVEEDGLFPFGAMLKSNTARALRRTKLTDLQKSRLRQHVVDMLALGVIPREMREYVKLLRTLGVGEHWPRLDSDIPRENPYAMRFYKSLRTAEGRPV